MKKQFLSLLFIAIVTTSYAQLSWLQIPDFPGTGKRGVASFSINNKGYMGLGLTAAGGRSTDWYEYNPGTNAWTQKASFPSIGRAGVVCFVIGNKGYVATGSTGASTNELWEYDPAADSWTAKASAPVFRESAAGFSIGNKGYLGTGYLGGSSYDDFYEYNPITDAWTAKASFPGQARNGSGGFSIGNYGFIGMGNNTNSTSNFKDFYQYDPSTDAWTQKADFPLPFVVEPTMYSSATDGFALCGYFYQYTSITHNPMNMLYKYDLAADAWSLEGTFPGLPRGYAGGFSLSNDIYIGGGGQTNGIGDLITDAWKLSNGLTLKVADNTGATDVEFAIGPNPAGNSVHISSDLSGKIIDHIRLYDVTGKLIKTQKLRNNNDAIETGNLSKGVYFIELVTNKSEVLDGRFIKE